MREAVAGNYEGRWRVREGRESELTATERKRFIKSDECMRLVLRADGTFTHKDSVDGVWELSGTNIKCKPTRVDGHSQRDMMKAAEDQGRVFRLEFLFDPFALVVAGEALDTPDDRKLLFVRYSRV